MTIEQMVADRLAGTKCNHRHKLVMCGECKELFCPGCIDKDFYAYPEWISHIRCPYCKKKFDHELMLKSRRELCRGHYDPDSPPVWRVYKSFKGHRIGNRLKKKRREIDPDELLDKQSEEESDYYFWEGLR
jgi:hypothetical protein